MRPRVVVDDWKGCDYEEYRRLGMYHLVNLAENLSNLEGAAGVLVHPRLSARFESICSRLTPGAFIIVVDANSNVLQSYREWRRKGKYEPHHPFIVSTYDQMRRVAVSRYDQAFHFANRPSEQQPI
ncbi:MAG TPA: hypothetical protein VJB87_01595 [Candidatus Nanoarchaeia archaeon]|nr:hypothetical protein [Candidatus Nanoarchaeia archaeon]